MTFAINPLLSLQWLVENKGFLVTSHHGFKMPSTMASRKGDSFVLPWLFTKQVKSPSLNCLDDVEQKSLLNADMLIDS